MGLNGLLERFQPHIPSLPVTILGPSIGRTVNLATMSQGFASGYSDAELEDIEKEVAPLA